MRVEDREKVGIVASNPKPRPPPNPSTTIFVANVSGHTPLIAVTMATTPSTVGLLVNVAETKGHIQSRR